MYAYLLCAHVCIEGMMSCTCSMYRRTEGMNTLPNMSRWVGKNKKEFIMTPRAPSTFWTYLYLNKHILPYSTSPEQLTQMAQLVLKMTPPLPPPLARRRLDTFLLKICRSFLRRNYLERFR